VGRRAHAVCRIRAGNALIVSNSASSSALANHNNQSKTFTHTNSCSIQTTYRTRKTCTTRLSPWYSMTRSSPRCPSHTFQQSTEQATSHPSSSIPQCTANTHTHTYGWQTQQISLTPRKRFSRPYDNISAHEGDLKSSQTQAPHDSHSPKTPPKQIIKTPPPSPNIHRSHRSPPNRKKTVSHTPTRLKAFLKL
jgi:hypothetical protein